MDGFFWSPRLVICALWTVSSEHIRDGHIILLFMELYCQYLFWFPSLVFTCVIETSVPKGGFGTELQSQTRIRNSKQTAECVYLQPSRAYIMVHMRTDESQESTAKQTHTRRTRQTRRERGQSWTYACGQMQTQ